MDSIRTYLVRARRHLEEAGIAPDEAALDARVLAEHALGWNRSELLAGSSACAPDGFADLFERLVDRRAAREPLAYITGSKEFWGLDFTVSRAVLIPRPETELLVETALTRCPMDRVRIADVCTGSGCIAVALAHERPSARLVATDSSPQALEVAQRNADRHGVRARIEFLESDLLDDTTGSFDLIVSNPPYVPDNSRGTLQPEIREYEPPLALFGGPNGLTVLERLVAQSSARLRPGGFLMFEFGAGQEPFIREMVSRAPGLKMIDLKRDLQGIPRTAVAQLAGMEVPASEAVV